MGTGSSGFARVVSGSRRLPAFFAALLVVLFAGAAGAQEGLLDESFWTDGRVVLSPQAEGEFSVSAVLTAPDGALVVSSRRALANGTVTWSWQRVTDLSIDPLCDYTPPGSTDVGYRGPAAFDREGRLLLAGGVYMGPSNVVGGLARFLYPACTPDPAFGTGGFVALDLTSGFELLTGLVVDAQGRIFLSGLYLATAVADTLVVALDAEGAPRAGEFGADGWVRIDALAQNRTEIPTALVLQPDGKLVVAGVLDGITAAFPSEMYSVRLLPDGAPDPDFGAPANEGGVTVGFGSTDASATDLAFDPGTGRLALGGEWTTGTGASAAAVAVLLADGSLDAGFDGDGKQTFQFGALTSSSIAALEFDGLGRLLVAGSAKTGTGSDYQFTAARFLTQGAFDNGFGDAGIAIVPFDLGNPPSDRAARLTFQAGRPVLAGEIYLANDTSKPGLARLQTALIFADGFASGTTGSWGP